MNVDASVDVFMFLVCVCVCVRACVSVCWFWCYRSYKDLHFLLNVAGQKNLTFFNLPVTLSFLPWTFFLHLLTGFTATYKSHVNFLLPWSRNVFEFSHSPRGVLHFFLQVPGQNFLTFCKLNCKTSGRCHSRNIWGHCTWFKTLSRT